MIEHESNRIRKNNEQNHALSKEFQNPKYIVSNVLRTTRV